LTAVIASRNAITKNDSRIYNLEVEDVIYVSNDGGIISKRDFILMYDGVFTDPDKYRTQLILVSATSEFSEKKVYDRKESQDKFYRNSFYGMIKSKTSLPIPMTVNF
jgi:hypothetical protein